MCSTCQAMLRSRSRTSVNVASPSVRARRLPNKSTKRVRRFNNDWSCWTSKSEIFGRKERSALALSHRSKCILRLVSNHEVHQLTLWSGRWSTRWYPRVSNHEIRQLTSWSGRWPTQWYLRVLLSKLIKNKKSSKGKSSSSYSSSKMSNLILTAAGPVRNLSLTRLMHKASKVKISDLILIASLTQNFEILKHHRIRRFRMPGDYWSRVVDTLLNQYVTPTQSQTLSWLPDKKATLLL